MQHVTMLAVGGALTAMALAMAPGVANAETKLDGKVDAALKGDGSGANKGGDGANLDGKADGALKNGGNGGANLESQADGPLKGGADGGNLDNTTLDNATKSEHRVDLNDPPLVGGDTKSITEVNAPIVPAEGEVKVDGNAVMDGLVDEGFCVRGVLNQSASGCGGGSAGSNDNSNLDIDTDEFLGNTTVDSVTNTDQRLHLNDPPLLDGDITTINEVNSDLVPARGNADVDADAEADGLLEEELCGRVALNSGAGDCGSGNGDTDNENTDNGINLGNTIADLAGTATNNDTTSDQQVHDDPLQSTGTTISNTDVIAPTIPAFAKAQLKGNVEAPGLVNQDVGVCGTLNSENCGSGGSEPASASDNGNGTDLDLGDLVTDLDGIDADSGTAIEENVDLANLQQEGTVDNTNNVDAPTVPASAKAELIGDAKVGETVDQNINSCSTLNAECSGGSDAASDTGNGAGIDLGDPLAHLEDISANNDTSTNQQVNDDPLQSGGNTISNTDADAPAVPASAKAELDGNAILGERIGQDVISCTSLNAENCGGDPASAPGSGDSNGNNGIDLGNILEDIAADSDTTIDETVNLDEARLDGTLDSANDTEAPVVPGSAKAEFDDNVSVPGLVNQGVSSCTTLNAAGCSSDAAPAAGDDADDGTSDDSVSGDAVVSTTDGGSEDNGSGSDNSGSGSDDSGNGSDDSSDRLAFAAPADSNSGSSDSGSDNSGSGNNSDEPASAASLSGNRTQPLAARYSGIRIQSLAASHFSDRIVALAAGPSEGRGKASASSGSAAKGDRLPDTGGVSPLGLIAALLFIGGGIVLVTRRRRFNS